MRAVLTVSRSIGTKFGPNKDSLYEDTLDAASHPIERPTPPGRILASSSITLKGKKGKILVSLGQMPRLRTLIDGWGYCGAPGPVHAVHLGGAVAPRHQLGKAPFVTVAKKRLEWIMRQNRSSSSSRRMVTSKSASLSMATEFQGNRCCSERSRAYTH